MESICKFYITHDRRRDNVEIVVWRRVVTDSTTLSQCGRVINEEGSVIFESVEEGQKAPCLLSLPPEVFRVLCEAVVQYMRKNNLTIVPEATLKGQLERPDAHLADMRKLVFGKEQP